MRGSKKDCKENLKFDVIIIGGGITGCAMLWEAAHRGLSALLLEQKDFASETSANSMKTIHGGIRYLQELNIKRTYESAVERLVLEQVAPNVVSPLSCFLPAENNFKKSALALFLGSLAYNAVLIFAKLFNWRNISNIRFSQLKSRACVHSVFGNIVSQPALNWFDAQASNSERLAFMFILKAQHAGARAENYVKVKRYTIDGKRVNGVEARLRDGRLKKYIGSTVIDCTGSSELLKECGVTLDSKIRKVAAVNLIFESNKVGGAIGLRSQSENKASSMLFFAPWLGCTIAGTWYFDKDKEGFLSKADLTEKLIYSMIKETALGLYGHCSADVVSDLQSALVDVHFGILPGSSGGQYDSPESSLLKKSKILTAKQHGLKNLINVNAVKYTTARLTAEKIISSIDVDKKASGSKSIGLYKAMSRDEKALLRKYYGESIVTRLNELYGDQAMKMTDILRENPDTSGVLKCFPEVPVAEVVYAVKYEMVRYAEDFLLRRTNIGLSNGTLSSESSEIDELISKYSSK